MHLSDIDKARKLFKQANLAFPTIPGILASQLRQYDKWFFSTRDQNMWPYVVQDYVKEAKRSKVDDYVVLAHSGYGLNSYAIHYYVVIGGLRMFLQLAWGGVYEDAEECSSKIAECFSVADRVMALAANRLAARDMLLIVCSDFYGSYWLKPGHDDDATTDVTSNRDPAETLREVLLWLEESDQISSPSGLSTGV